MYFFCYFGLVKRTRLLLLLILISFVCFGQTNYTKQFSFINDNDLYVSTQRDRYYTNGIFLSYNFLSTKERTKTIKKIYSIEIGQELYSPFKANVNFLSEHDRPFAGYLFGGFGISNFYKNNSIFKLNGRIGIIGPSAFGEELMNFVHDIYGFEPATGWKYQIQDAFTLNLSIDYTKNLSDFSSDFFDFNWRNKINIGSIFTDISSGFTSRIGIKSLQKITNSIGFNSKLNNKDTKLTNTKEMFFYVNPMLRFTIYDATIQGSFFNDNNIITYDIKPIVLTTEIGFRFSLNNFNFKYAIIHHTKKLESVRVPNSNFYGSIEIHYLFN